MPYDCFRGYVRDRKIPIQRDKVKVFEIADTDMNFFENRGHERANFEH